MVNRGKMFAITKNNILYHISVIIIDIIIMHISGVYTQVLMVK